MELSDKGRHRDVSDRDVSDKELHRDVSRPTSLIKYILTRKKVFTQTKGLISTA